MKIGVFVPIGNNGWLISTHAPQHVPTFELNKAIVQESGALPLGFCAVDDQTAVVSAAKPEFWGSQPRESFNFNVAGGGGHLADQIYATAATPHAAAGHLSLIMASTIRRFISGGRRRQSGDRLAKLGI